MKPRTVVLVVVALVLVTTVGTLGFLLVQELLGRGVLLPGEQALEILRASPYPNLVVEVDSTPGDRPTQFALDVLQARLVAYTSKETVQVVFSDVIQVNQTVLDTLDLLDLERTHRDGVTGGDTFVLYLLSISGQLTNGESALGAAYTAASLALFKDVVRQATGGFGISASEVEASVLTHELGHLMGLVNLVYTSVLDYEDAEHPFHSANESDVMYWAIESAPLGSPATDFGSETQLDLRMLHDGEYEVFPSRLRELAHTLPDFALPSRSGVPDLRGRWPAT